MELQWKTANEINARHFEIERSFNGVSYQPIAIVPASGSPNSQKEYMYIDHGPLAEKNYYRLKMVDMDGQFNLSNIVLIKLTGVKQDILVMNNPFKDNLQLRFVISPDEGGQLQLTDITGRLVASRAFSRGEQEINFSLPKGRLSPGVYMLRAILSRKTYTVKLLKE